MCVLGANCSQPETPLAVLINSTTLDSGHTHQAWGHPESDSIIYRVILDGTGTSIPPPTLSAFQTYSGHEHGPKDNTTDTTAPPHPRRFLLHKRASVWRAQAHTKMYNNKNGPHTYGTEALWEFHTDSGGDKWIEVIPTAHNFRLKWVNYSHRGCWLSDCWTVQTQYEEWDNGWNPDNGSRHWYDMQTQHEWVFWNKGSRQNYCKCIADCMKCTK